MEWRKSEVLAELVKKRITDHDFPPPFMWAANNNFKPLIAEFLFGEKIVSCRNVQQFYCNPKT